MSKVLPQSLTSRPFGFATGVVEASSSLLGSTVFFALMAEDFVGATGLVLIVAIALAVMMKRRKRADVKVYPTIWVLMLVGLLDVATPRSAG